MSFVTEEQIVGQCIEKALHGIDKHCEKSRELSLARTKLEEAQMWLDKHVIKIRDQSSSTGADTKPV